MSLEQIKKLEKNIINNFVLTVFGVQVYDNNKHNNFKDLLDSDALETIREVMNEAMNDEELRNLFLALSY